MKKWNLVCWCLCVLSTGGQTLSLQRLSFPVIDGSYSHKQLLLSAGLSNPSILTNLKSFAAAVEMEATYLVEEARLFSAMVVQPFDHSAIALLVVHNGSHEFTRSTVSLLLNRDLGNVQLGGEFLFHHSRITGYSTAAKMDAGIFFRIEMSPVFNAGFRLRNLTRLFVHNEEGYSPVIQAGAGYDISEAIQLGCEWLQDPGQAAVVTTGLLYRFHKSLVMIAGITWTPCQPYGGFQLNYHHWKLLLKTSFHPELGWSPSIGISFGKLMSDTE